MKKLPSGLGVAGLQILDIHGAAAAPERLGLRLRVVDERDDRGEIGVAKIRTRHALVGTPLTDQRADLVAAHVFGDERRAREIGSTLAARGVAAVTEAALRKSATARLAPDRLDRTAGVAVAGGFCDAGLSPAPRPCPRAGTAARRTRTTAAPTAK